MSLLKLAGTIPALAFVGALTATSGVEAAPITPTFETFGDLNAATSTDVTFTGTGIPTDPSAIAEFTAGNGDKLLLGLTAHQRYSANPPLTNDGNGTFFATAGFNTPPGSTTPGTTWNFAWFAELGRAQGSTSTLATYGLELLYDLDAGVGTDETDHGVLSFADSTDQLSQSSQNAAFGFLQPGSPLSFITPPATSFDPFAGGEYTFALRSDLGDVAIKVNVAPIPLPAAGWLLLSAVGGLGFAARRRRKAA